MRVRPAVQPFLDLWPAKELSVARLLAQAGDAYKQSALVLIENQQAEQQKKQEPEGGSPSRRWKAEARSLLRRAPQPAEACSSSQHRSRAPQPAEACSSSRHRGRHRSRRRTRSRAAKRDRSGSRADEASASTPGSGRSRRSRSCNVRLLSSRGTPLPEQEVIPPKAPPHRHSYKRPQTAPRSPDPRTEQEKRPDEQQPEQRPEQPARREQPEQVPRRPADTERSWDDAWWALYRKEMPEEDYAVLSKTQRASRRRRFLKALTEAFSAKPACETRGGVSDETVCRD